MKTRMNLLRQFFQSRDKVNEHKTMKAGGFRLIFVLLTISASLSACGQERVMPQDGDIVFHESNSRQSPVIKLAQHSRWTHCGIVFHIGEKAYVYEAVEPVKYTPLKDWIARGKDGEYRVKRLKKPLPAEAVAKMKAVGGRYKGKHYDTLFQWSDNKMYCSELVWKIYAQGADIELCEPGHFSDFPIKLPAVKKLIKERYGNSFNPDEKIISPQALFRSRLLKDVHYADL